MLDRLRQLVPPPRQPFAVPPSLRPPSDISRTWEEAEETLGVTFPREHKELVDCYGDGVWGGSLKLITPRFCNVYRNTVEVATRFHLFQPRALPLSNDVAYERCFRDSQQAARIIHVASPFEFYPYRPGLLPLGYVGNNYLGLNPHGVYLFWCISRDGRHEEKIVALSENLTFRAYRFGLCSFLVRLFQGDVDLCMAFDAKRGFESYWKPRHGMARNE